MIYLIPVIASAAAALWRLRTRTLWLLVFLCLLVNPVTYQWWGLYHYVLGTKYFEQLGYAGLYECTAAVASTDTRRDLATYDFRFDDPKCNLNGPDVLNLFMDVRGYPYHEGMLTDKGLNATPSWIALFHPLVDFPVSVLILIDPLALIAALLVVGRFASWRKAAYAALFILVFYGTFGRLWGHYAQWVWLALSLAGMALVRAHRERGAALIGAAAGLMIFPGVLVLMLRSRRALVWFALGFGTVLVLGMANPRGINGYLEFVGNMRLHSNYIRSEPYNIGLGNTLTMLVNQDVQSEYRQCFTHGNCSRDYEYESPGLLFPALLPLVALTPWGLMFGLLTLSRYYYLILAVIALENERHIRVLLALNAALFLWLLLDWNSVYVHGHLLWIVFFVYLGMGNLRRAIGNGQSLLCQQSPS